MTVKIYVMIDPTTNEIKYVGRTSKPSVNIRLIEHLSKAKFHVKYKRRATPVINWINKLLEQGLSPIIKEIEEVEGWKESHIRERELIVFYKKTCKLTNLMDKGMGHLNNYIDAETKIKISNTLKKRYKEGMENKGYISLRKLVYQFDINGKLLNIFPSAAIASYNLNLKPANIIQCCNKLRGRKKAGGFVFSYTNKFPETFIGNSYHKKIIVIDILINKELFFKTIKNCSIELNVCPQTIREYIKSKKLFKNRYKIING